MERLERRLPPKSKPSDPKFAVFPDYETGRKAQAKRLKEGDLYIDLTLEDLPKRYVGVNLKDPDTPDGWDVKFGLLAKECGMSESLNQAIEIVDHFYKTSIASNSLMMHCCLKQAT